MFTFSFHDIYINIKLKFDIQINNDELLETIWEHKKRKKVDNEC